MDVVENSDNKISWFEKPVSSIFPRFTLEHLLVALIIIMAVFSRFYDVGLRVMSHDETNHVVPSYDLYQGRGYSHDPITHGPLQFHLVAASYFLFGDSDFSSRVPSALFSVATIIFVLFAFRRYLGRTGALLAGLFFLVSPYMMFYGRYTRNESFVAFFGVLMLYAVLRYLETGKNSALYLFTIALVLQFITKETSFIYTAEMLIFLAIVFLRDVIKMEWRVPARRDLFIFAMMAVLLFAGVALGAAVLNAGNSGAEAAASAPASVPAVFHILLLVSLALALIALVFALILLIQSVGWKVVKEIRSFDLLILTISMVLPQLIAFPMNLVGFNPLDYSQTGLIHSSLFLLGAVILSLALGILWKPRLWAINIVIFYAIFTVFYTTFFTNGQGFFTGLVGSLGYWLSQQGVNRGSQPWYFFAFLQIPMYEYLPAFGTILAVLVGLKRKLFSTFPGIAPAEQVGPTDGVNSQPVEVEFQPNLPEMESVQTLSLSKPEKLPVLALLVYWSVMSLVAYTIAGEKMPWLTVHITLPMLLCAGFSFGYLIDRLPFKQLAGKKTWLTLVLLPVFLVSLGSVVASLLGTQKPFAGKDLAQLQATSTFLFAVIGLVASGWFLLKLIQEWERSSVLKVLVLTLGAILLVLTSRSAVQASFINYDTAKEFLVYAHAARGPKDILAQVEDISLRTTGGKDIKVAYIGEALYPYWWYFRDYPNKVWLQDNLTRDLLNYPVVITDDEHLSKTQAILKDGYFQSKYIRLVWPMQDYFNMTWNRLWKGITNPEMRQAVFNIWLNKDYTLYSKVSGNNNLTLENWQPSGSLYLFIKKDIVSQIWSYGALPAPTETVQTDPYAGKYISLVPDRVFGTAGNEKGQLTAPRGIAIASDGSIYVTDSQNHRIEKFDLNGKFILSWGSYATVDGGKASGGTFNEPWGIAVGPDGSVYVADTWNHRIQKFTADGKFLLMWGVPGLAEQPDHFWGPRGIAVDKSGLVYVTDTGNNRVVIFDSNGTFKTQFGVSGITAGEFDEPVGIAVGGDGLVYVADTWNQRIQVFEPTTQSGFAFVREWPVSGWFGQSINNKPFLALDANNNVYVTDPDGFRVLEFDSIGNFLRGWGEASSGIDGFGSPCGIAVDIDGKVWVSDAENNFVLRFTLPELTVSKEQSKIPDLAEGLVYNPLTGLVSNTMGMPVYHLSSDGVEWVPVIPEGIASLLPAGASPVKDSQGNWELLNGDGSQSFTWDPLSYAWISTNPTP